MDFGGIFWSLFLFFFCDFDFLKFIFQYTSLHNRKCLYRFTAMTLIIFFGSCTEDWLDFILFYLFLSGKMNCRNRLLHFLLSALIHLKLKTEVWLNPLILGITVGMIWIEKSFFIYILYLNLPFQNQISLC